MKRKFKMKLKERRSEDFVDALYKSEKMNEEDEIDYKQKYNDLLAHINTTPFVTSPMGDLPVTSTTVRNLLDKLIKTEEENRDLRKQIYDLNLYINTIEEIQN